MHARLNFVKAAPAGMAALGNLRAILAKGALPSALIELVYLRVSQINGCVYCIDVHTRDLIKRGISPEKLSLIQVWPEVPELFTPEEYAALAWAEAVTNVSLTGVPDLAYQAASAVFEAKPLADLTKEKEVASMPLAGHGNNHSSESLQGKDAPKQ